MQSKGMDSQLHGLNVNSGDTFNCNYDKHICHADVQNLHMLRTSRSRRLICVNGFLYRLEGKLHSHAKTFRWLCIRHRDVDCKARIYTEALNKNHHKVNRYVENHTHGSYSSAKLASVFKKHNIREITEHKVHKNKKNCHSEHLGNIINIPQCSLNSKDTYSDSNNDRVNSNKISSRRPIGNALDVDYIPAPTSTSLTDAEINKESPNSFKLGNDPLSTVDDDQATMKTSKKDKVNFTFLPSAKGNKVLCLNNFIYHFDSRSPRNGRSYWTCLLRRNKIYKCNGRITTEMTAEGPIIVKITGSHKHPDCSYDITRRLLKSSETQGTNMDSEPNCLNRNNIDFKKIALKSKESIERRMERLYNKRTSILSNEDSDDSSTSSSSLESDDDHLDNTDLPTKLEDMRQPAPNLTERCKSMENDAEEVDDLSHKSPINENYPPKHLEENDSKQQNLESYEQKSLDHLEPDMDITKVSKLRSAKGGVLLCVDGFLYHFKSIQKNRSYWACIKCRNRTINCKSRIATVLSDKVIKIVKVTNHHSHYVNGNDIKKRLNNEFVRYGPLKNFDKPKHVLEKTPNNLTEEYAKKLTNIKGKRTQYYFPKRDECPYPAKGKRLNMKLYAVSDGPPSLAVRMALKALNIPYELINVDYIAAEHLTEKYAQLNPQKEIPVLDDNGFYLSESIAIMQYLCDKYAPDSQLYPKDPKERAIVNQRLCFNSNFYYSSISVHALAPIFFDIPRTELSLKKVNNALKVFQTYLERLGTKYAAANHITIADFPLISATLGLEAINFDISPYPLVQKWYETFKQEQPELWKIANGGLKELADFAKNPPDLSHMNHPFFPTRKPKN